jgi:hypothetical protein
MSHGVCSEEFAWRRRRRRSWRDRDEDGVDAFDGCGSLNDDGEPRGTDGEALAEDGLSQEQKACEEEDDDDEAAGCSRCGHGEAPWNDFSVPGKSCRC